MSGKPSKHQKQLARQKRHQLLVRCDDCGLVQPFAHGRGGMHPDRSTPIAACSGCGGHYGTYV